MGKVKLWSSRSISFAGRAQLLNSVIFGMFSYWAAIFILPQMVIDQINSICRNYLWGGVAEYAKVPYISWSTTCSPRKMGGIGLKNIAAWNRAYIAKLIWHIALKKDVLWVKWIHSRYLKSTSWWDYHAPADCSWYWRKVVHIKEMFKQGIHDQIGWKWTGGDNYTVQAGYHWLLGDQVHSSWTKVVWARPVTPRHAFITWIFMHQRLPVSSRLARFTGCDSTCVLCNDAEEDSNHLFFHCRQSQTFWQLVQQ